MARRSQGGEPRTRAARLRRTPLLEADALTVRAALGRRGLVWNGQRDPTPLLLPGPRLRESHYELLGHYAYRLFLRDVLKHRADLRIEALARYATATVTRRYLGFLTRAQLVERTGRRRYRLRAPGVTSFGQTLEWYVAEVLRREFGCATVFGLRIPRAAYGGDYDVIACAEGEVLYVETKSAPPRQILESEVRAFLDRVDTLRPDCALFLADTHLRMGDKLVPLFATDIARRRLAWEPVRLEREIWRVGPEVYLLNTAPHMTRNLRVCVTAHFRRRGIAVVPASSAVPIRLQPRASRKAGMISRAKPRSTSRS
jgi:hypothetical protein